jgi:voltage-gated potassium channel
MKKLESIENALYYLVREKDEVGNWPTISRMFNYFLMALILLSVGEMALETDIETYKAYQKYFDSFDYFTVIVFTIEYVIRILTAHLVHDTPGKNRREKIWHYVTSPAGIVDLLSILPFYLSGIDTRMLRMLRLMRFFRVFKITRYNDSVKDIVEVIKDKRSEIGVIMGLIIIIMIISSFLMFYAENKDNNEAFPNVLSCLWWAVVTMTTIGYGDVYPITVMGKIIASIMALLGIGLVAMPTGIISAGFLEKVNEKKEKKLKEDEKEKLKKDEEASTQNKKNDENGDNDTKHFCPYCGHRID